MIPQEIQKSLTANQKVRWWGRRATFEIVEEVSQSTFRMLGSILVGAWLEQVFFIPVVGNLWGHNQYMYWAAWGFVCLIFAQHGLVEYMTWKHEIHVVCQNDYGKGGRVYKFWRRYKNIFWYYEQKHDEPIGDMFPTIDVKTNTFYKLWGKITGEKMERTTLMGVNARSFVEGQRIHPDYERAVSRIRGHQGNKETAGESPLATLEDLQQAKLSGLINEKLANDAAERLVRKTVWGV